MDVWIDGWMCRKGHMDRWKVIRGFASISLKIEIERPGVVVNERIKECKWGEVMSYVSQNDRISIII